MKKLILLSSIILLLAKNAYGFDIPRNAILSAKIIDLSNNNSVYEHNPEYLLYPASNQKIITLYAALKLLPKDYRFKTELLTNTKNIYIKFSGDPTLSYDQLDALLANLKNKKFVNVILDVSAFDSEHYPSGWMHDQNKFCFSAPISAGIVDKNCQEFNININKLGKLTIQPQTRNLIDMDNKAQLIDTADRFCEFELASLSLNKYKLFGCYTRSNVPSSLKIAINSPDKYLQDLITLLLKKNNIKYNKLALGETAKDAMPISNVSSQSLQELLSKMMKYSDNQIADALFKKIAQHKSKLPGNWKIGSKIITDLMREELKADESSLQITDGSGLSRKDLLSAGTITLLLQSAYRDNSIKDDFIATFPQSGIEGTVKDRFKEEHRFKILAKTGGAENTSSLSGYAFNDAGKAYAFSIIFNGFTGDKIKILKLEEEILLSAIDARFHK